MRLLLLLSLFFFNTFNVPPSLSISISDTALEAFVVPLATESEYYCVVLYCIVLLYFIVFIVVLFVIKHTNTQTPIQNNVIVQGYSNNNKNKNKTKNSNNKCHSFKKKSKTYQNDLYVHHQHQHQHQHEEHQPFQYCHW